MDVALAAETAILAANRVPTELSTIPETKAFKTPTR